MTSFFESLVLGAVQGITEWLPISSEGINTLILLHFFRKPLTEAIGISIWLHTGTLFAAVIYFRRDIMDLLRHLPQYIRELGTGGTEWNTLTTFLLISTLLTGLVGAPIMVFGLSQRAIPTGLVMAIIGVLLIITGVVQKYAPRSSETKATISIKDTIVLGVVQAFSVFPGLSRSGLTVSALLFRGYDAKAAIRLSFLMSIPAVLAAEVGLGLINGVSFALPSVSGIVTAFVLGILTIGALLRIATKIHFWQFCLFLGGLSLLPLLIEGL
jgi:undecaprenyl-diphosphatase